MKIFTLTALVCLLLSDKAAAWRFFHLGRMKGGNLGLPYKHGNLEQEKRNFTRWFTQKLDHFEPGNLDTWHQRYYVNDEFFDLSASKKSVFLMIGGEGEATDKWMTQGAWIDYAKTFNALCFQLEHRYYGKSRPTENLSIENLNYLTSQQALADLAVFITAMNEQYHLSPVDTKWIAFGGSYPGSLAAWLRLKYPHLVHGSVSSSGPLLAVPDFQDYYKVVADDLRNINKACYDIVKKGTSQVDVLMRHMVSQRSLTQMFKLCDPLEKSISNKNDIANFYDILAGNFAGIAQYNKDNRVGNSSMSNVTLEMVCDMFMGNESGRMEIRKLAQLNNLILNATNQTCTDFKYQNMIDQYRNVSWDAESAEGGRQWMYQTCNEFGFYQTSDKKPQTFGDKFPLDFYIKQCEDIFGPKYNAQYVQEAAERTNTLYGALDIEVTNVVFVHGSVDPWHALGITQTLNQGAPAIFIKGTAHCANMYPKSDKDPPQLQAARVQVQQYIEAWLDH